MNGTTQKAEFEAATGEKLAAALELPSGKPHAFVLFAHCFSCTKDIKAAREIARALRAQGFAVLRFDFTGLGASEGDFANTNFSSNVDDLVQAADFLRREFEAPQILIGHSLGGAASIVAAGHIPEVHGVAVIGAPAEAEHVVAHIGSKRDEIERDGKATVDLAGRPFTIKKQFLEDLSDQNVVEAATNLERSLLILHAPFDQTVGIENASMLFNAARHPKSFVSLDDADHLLSDPEDARYAANVITSWASRYLDLGKTGLTTTKPELPKSSLPESGQLESLQPEIFPTAPKGGAAASLMPGHGFATALSIDGFSFVIDASKAEGGDDLGPNPTRTVEAALAACGVMTMQMYANRKGWPLEGATVTVEKGKGEDSHNARVLEKTYAIEGALDADQKSRLIEMADKCPVHRMLTGEVTIRHKG